MTGKEWYLSRKPESKIAAAENKWRLEGECISINGYKMCDKW